MKAFSKIISGAAKFDLEDVQPLILKYNNNFYILALSYVLERL